MKNQLSIFLISILTLAAQIVAAQTAKIDNVWLEHGVKDSYGTKGMKIHLEFSIENAQGLEGKCIAYFYDAQKKDLFSDVQNYSTTAKTACVSKHFNPENPIDEYDNFDLFIPYSALEFSPGSNRYYVRSWVCCTTSEGFKFLTSYRDLPFIGTGRGSDASVDNDVSTSDTSRAQLTLLSPLSTSKQKYHLRVGVNSESLVTGKNVTLNGNANNNFARGIGLSDNNGYQMEVEQDLILEEGDNLITVEVTTAAGISTRKYTVTYTAAPEPSANIDSLWVELDVMNNGEKGIVVHHNFNIYNSNSNDECLVSVYREEAKPGETPKKVMQTVVSADFKSTDDQNSYPDFAIFMPYSSMKLSPNTYYVRSKIVHDVDEANKTLAFSDYVKFTLGQADDNKETDNKTDNKTDANINNGDSTTANKRVALVIGNSTYPMEALATSINDANDIARKLQSLGFNVVLGNNMSHEGLDKAIANFGTLAKEADVAVFYYAGYGIQRDNSNYLIPTDAKLPYAEKVKYECVDAAMVVSMMKNAKQKLMILNPNHTNPFEKNWSDGEHDGNSMAEYSADNMLFVYSPNLSPTAANGRNGAFAAALLDNLTPNGNGILDVMMKTNRLLRELTGKSQSAKVLSTLYEDIIFNRQ